MESQISAVLLDDRDGLNPARALILQAYFALRRVVGSERIGCSEIAAWIKTHEPKEPVASEGLIRLTLSRYQLLHRAPGRPRKDSRVTAPPFLCPHRLPSPVR